MVGNPNRLVLAVLVFAQSSLAHALSDCNQIPVGFSENLLLFRADANGDCYLDYRDLFEVARSWNGGRVRRGYRVDPDYLLQVRLAEQRFGNLRGTGDANLDGNLDNEDFELFLLNQDLGLTDCACGNETEFAWFAYTMDLDRVGEIDSTDTGLFECLFEFGATCTPSPTTTPSLTPTPSHTPTLTLAPTPSRTATDTMTPTPSQTATPSTTPDEDGCTIVDVVDHELELTIRLQLNKAEGPLTSCDLAGLTSLYRTFTNSISSLEGLEHATNLRTLSLWRFSGGDQIGVSDLTPISSLVDLETLNLGGHQIANLEPLSGLIRLRELTLDSNEIADVSPLSNLDDLVYLDVAVNRLTDISPLAHLQNLNFLSVRINQISDLGPLVDNLGLGFGDSIRVDGNPLSVTAQCQQIPNLQNRFVDVEFDQTVSCD